LKDVRRLKDLLNHYKEISSIGMNAITRIANIQMIQNNVAVCEIIQDVAEQYGPVISRIELIIEEMEGI